MRCCLVVSCVGFGFFVPSQLASRLSLFLLDHTASLLVLVFTASCVTARSFCVSDLDSLSLLSSLHGFLCLIT